MPWTLYILRCKDDTLYTGITNDLERRINEHKTGKGAKYTKGRSPLKLIYQEVLENKSSALKREIQIKRLKRKEKYTLIGSNYIRGQIRS